MDFRQNGSLYLMGLPVIAFYLIFSYLPMYGVIIAFKDFFGSYYFWQLFKNTLAISIATLLFGFPAPIILALLINEIKSKRFSGVVKTISYLPHFISVIVICGMIRSFVGQNGIITQFFAVFGFESKNMLNEPG